jgi:hypothetical protein
MPARTRTAPLCQIRVIGPADDVTTLIVQLAARTRLLFGSQASYRTHTRSARRAGYVRAYLTITGKEPPDDHHG